MGVLQLYAAGSFYKDKINPYHNVCHGFMTMIIAADLYKEEAKAQIETRNDYDDNTFVQIAFAGLFHDVLHPGFGNMIFNKKKDNPDEYVNKNLFDKFIENIGNVQILNDSDF